jgi:hypothetical protein
MRKIARLAASFSAISSGIDLPTDGKQVNSG